MARINNSFSELQERIYKGGFLKSSSCFYIRRVLMMFALLIVSMIILATIKNFWLQMFNAMFLAFIYGQFSLFFHDVGHGQVTGRRWHTIMGIWSGMMLGWNLDWWASKHNRHHAFPNQPGYDPDVDISFLAFSEDQAQRKKGLCRVIARHQDIFFVPLLLGEVWHLRCASIAYLLERRTLKNTAGLFFIIAHLVLYGVLLFYFLPLWHAIAFAVVHWGILGIYLGLIFAPNHKGMPMVEHDTLQGFFEQQVLTARNIRGGWLIDMLYGGLNYQIEHHLFPSMPRNRLPHIAPIVEMFCKEKNISYHAVGVRESFQDIFGHLGRIGKQVD